MNDCKENGGQLWGDINGTEDQLHVSIIIIFKNQERLGQKSAHCALKNRTSNNTQDVVRNPRQVLVRTTWVADKGAPYRPDQRDFDHPRVDQTDFGHHWPDWRDFVQTIGQTKQS